ncbi:uncharacterized protein STEHIDRAFT_151422 [Stereum hirsutum FP-91666 SS1]|uniref:uncharacterized protein n=1 Tax=Stereum hirsutum (strain FP-91666) TaxID=721885 RepID=UPI000440F96C|nr:uncharacterized protein STEHIDRAFT_151422 [Stereum hirsutum FP-91666 SS1]EIM92077.1 hypothetical protein STEHIDRAFT_151422 [Stereum hirsutum FP-91666 SS1]
MYQDARINGAFAGLTSGLLGSNIASRLWKLSRNSSIFAGVRKFAQLVDASIWLERSQNTLSSSPAVTAALSGYYFSEGFMAANLSRARAEVSAQKKQTEFVDSPS